MRKTEYEQYQDNYQTASSVLPGDYSVSSTTGARARARAREEAGDQDERRIKARIMRGWYEDACVYYQQSFDSKLSPVISRDIAGAIAQGITGDVVRAAMDATQDAPRPSWAYCRAILQRCERDGIRTLADWAADREAWQRRQQGNPALQYSQRDYHAEDFGEDFFFDVVGEYGKK